MDALELLDEIHGLEEKSAVQVTAVVTRCEEEFTELKDTHETFREELDQRIECANVEMFNADGVSYEDLAADGDQEAMELERSSKWESERLQHQQRVANRRAREAWDEEKEKIDTELAELEERFNEEFLEASKNWKENLDALSSRFAVTILAPRLIGGFMRLDPSNYNLLNESAQESVANLFEHLVCFHQRRLAHLDAPRVAEVMGGAGDKGIDVRVRSSRDTDDLILIAQCKFGPSYRNKLHAILRELVGTCVLHGCTVAELWHTIPDNDLPSADARQWYIDTARKRGITLRLMTPQDCTADAFLDLVRDKALELPPFIDDLDRLNKIRSKLLQDDRWDCVWDELDLDHIIDEDPDFGEESDSSVERRSDDGWY